MVINQRSRNGLRRLAEIMLVGMVCLTSCFGRTPIAESVATFPVTTPTPAPSPTLSPTPPKVLKVCVAEDPGNLFRYIPAASRSRETVFEAIYDGPFEREASGNALSASFLSQIPARENGGIQVAPTVVKAGMLVMDAYGTPNILKAGLVIRPAGCAASDCAVAWDGSAGLSMDQESITYTFAPGALWSDGQPLVAADSVYAFQVSQILAPQALTWVMDRTAGYESGLGNTAVWTGIPGYLPETADRFFWAPLPRHALEPTPAEGLEDLPAAASVPLGWGPYRIVSRDNARLTLEKNPNYWQAASGLPKFDRLEIVVQADREAAIQGLQNGSCDVLDGSYALAQMDAEALTNLSKISVIHWQDWNAIEQLVFGISPASYDDGYSAWAGDRPDFFGSPLVRQAVLACINPQELAASVLSRYLPAGMAVGSLGLPTLAGNPADLLAEVGWQLPADGDGNVLVAAGVPNVPDGTEFNLTLLTGQSSLARDAAQAIVERLGQCGIGVTWQSLPVEQLYAPGPDGLLFGRQFDLALVSWQTDLPGCALYAASAIPSARNYWIGTNLAGFSDPAFDLDCARAQQAALTAVCQTCAGLEPAIPAIPLLPHLSAWASRPGLMPEGVDALNQIEFFQAP